MENDVLNRLIKVSIVHVVIIIVLSVRRILTTCVPVPFYPLCCVTDVVCYRPSSLPSTQRQGVHVRSAS